MIESAFQNAAGEFTQLIIMHMVWKMNVKDFFVTI